MDRTASRVRAGRKNNVGAGGWFVRAIAALTLCLTASPLAAQTSRIASDGNARLFLPDVAGPVRPPLLVMLHGRGSNRQHMDAVAPVAVKSGFAVVTMNAPVAMGDGRFQWPPGADIERVRGWLQNAVGSFPETAGETRWFVAGFSQGGWYAVLLAMARPEVVRGVLAMSAVQMADMPRLAAPKQVPLVLWAGNRDRYAARTADFFADLWRRAGSPVRVEHFDGGHTLPQEWRLRLPRALEFLQHPDSSGGQP